MNILDPQGPIAAANKTILIDSIAIMLAIVLPTIAAIFAFAFWFRQSNTRAVCRPGWVHSGRIELAVWSIPALTVLLLGGVAWIGSDQLDPARPDVAPHLAGSAGCSGQEAAPAGRRTEPSAARICRRDGRVLRAAACEHDLRHEPHRDAPRAAR